MRIEEYDSMGGQLTVGTKEKWMRALVLAVFHDGWVLGYRDRPNRVLLRRWCLVVGGKGYRSSQAPCSLVRINVGYSRGSGQLCVRIWLCLHRADGGLRINR